MVKLWSVSAFSYTPLKYAYVAQTNIEILKINISSGTENLLEFTLPITFNTTKIVLEYVQIHYMFWNIMNSSVPNKSIDIYVIQNVNITRKKINWLTNDH